jgi:hypothetical protein
MYIRPDELRQFWDYLRSSWQFRIVSVLLIVLVVIFNYFYHFKLRRFINRGKQTMTYLYLVVIVLNILYYWFTWDGAKPPRPSKPVESFSEQKPQLSGLIRSTLTKFKRESRNVSQLKKKIVAANQQWKCGMCGQLLDETYEVDHVVPLYRGGSNEISNLMALDPICHKKKTFRQQYIGGESGSSQGV